MDKLVAEYGEKSEGTGGVKYVQQDWRGSVRTVTNGNGFVVARTDHQAFGGDVGYGNGQRSIERGYNTDPATSQGYGLTERDDATGLDHTWFRKNENQAGRWTSPDPYNGSMNLGDPQSFNRYSYVQNQPTNFVAPSGLMLVAFVFTTCEWAPDGEHQICTQRLWITNIGGDGTSVPDFGGGGDNPQLPAPTDPCAGKKGSLKYDEQRPIPDPNGNRTAREHIKFNHIRTDVEVKKSKYGSGTLPDSMEFAIVTGINQLIFQLSTGVVQGNGNYAYVYAIPEVTVRRPLLPIEVRYPQFVGTDRDNGGKYTNVNTLIVSSDCQTVITSHPGGNVPGRVLKTNVPYFELYPR